MAKIIEFYGLPGCGKTTVASMLMAEVRREGYLICTEEIIYDNKNVERVLHLVRAFFAPRNYRFNYEAFWTLIQILGIKRFLLKIARFMKLIKLNSQIDCYRKENDYIILSEGYIQVLLGIFDDFELKKVDAELIRKILPKNEWTPIYLHVIVDVASDRIKQRRHDGDLWFEMSETERLHQLIRRECNNKVIEEELNLKKVEGDRSVDMVIVDLIEMIRDNV